MARVIFSAAINSISGSVGGSTFQKNAYGNTIRSKPNPILSQSDKQFEIRANLRLVQQAWTALTTDQKQQWNTFNTFSQSFSKNNQASLLSGYALFLKYNCIRLSAGLSILTTITYATVTYPYIVPEILEGVDGFIVDFSAAFDPALSFAQLFVSQYSPNNRYFRPNSLRQMNLILLGETTYSIADSYLSSFGSVPTWGNYVLISWRYFSLTSPLFSNVFSSAVLIVQSI